MIAGIKIEDGHVTLTTRILGWLAIPRLGFDTFCLCAKFDSCSLNHSCDITGDRKI